MSRSVFPNGIDTFTELFDLPANLVTSADELVRLKGKSILDNNEQNRIKALEAQLQDYMITPESFNKLTDSLTALETFFDQSVRGYIKRKQDEWDTYVNNFGYIGEWSNQSKYKKQNLVSFRGHLWLVLKDVVADNSHTPDITPEYYRQVAFKGDKGDIGLNATFKGNWSGSTNYVVGDAVFKDDVVFISRTNNTGKEPNQNPNDWFPYSLQIMMGTSKPRYLHPLIHYLEFY